MCEKCQLYHRCGFLKGGSIEQQKCGIVEDAARQALSAAPTTNSFYN